MIFSKNCPASANRHCILLIRKRFNYCIFIFYFVYFQTCLCFWRNNFNYVIQNANYEFVEFTMANRQVVCGFMYYLTFEARTPSDQTCLTFQAKVWEKILNKGTEVILCRINLLNEMFPSYFGTTVSFVGTERKNAYPQTKFHRSAFMLGGGIGIPLYFSFFSHLTCLLYFLLRILSYIFLLSF